MCRIISLNVFRSIKDMGRLALPQRRTT